MVFGALPPPRPPRPPLGFPPSPRGSRPPLGVPTLSFGSQASRRRRMLIPPSGFRSAVDSAEALGCSELSLGLLSTVQKTPSDQQFSNFDNRNCNVSKGSSGICFMAATVFRDPPESSQVILNTVLRRKYFTVSVPILEVRKLRPRKAISVSCPRSLVSQSTQAQGCLIPKLMLLTRFFPFLILRDSSSIYF